MEDVWVRTFEGMEEEGQASHSVYELMYLCAGSAAWRADGRTVVLGAGDGLLFPPGHAHPIELRPGAHGYVCRFSAEAGGHELHAWLRDEAAARLRALHAFAPEEPARDAPAAAHALWVHLDGPGEERVRGVLWQLVREQNDSMEGADELRRLSLRQLLVLLRRAARRDLPGTDAAQALPSGDWKEDMVRAFALRLEQQYAEPVDFAQLARQNGLSLVYFRAIFKQYTGFPPTEYLARVRVQKALELLQTTRLPISEIALQVGFDDANYFSRTFKKIVGYPPRYFKSIDRTP